jgi:hypothetical protein
MSLGHEQLECHALLSQILMGRTLSCPFTHAEALTRDKAVIFSHGLYGELVYHDLVGFAGKACSNEFIMARLLPPHIV